MAYDKFELESGGSIIRITRKGAIIISAFGNKQYGTSYDPKTATYYFKAQYLYYTLDGTDPTNSSQRVKLDHKDVVLFKEKPSSNVFKYRYSAIVDNKEYVGKINQILLSIPTLSFSNVDFIFNEGKITFDTSNDVLAGTIVVTYDGTDPLNKPIEEENIDNTYKNAGSFDLKYYYKNNDDMDYVIKIRLIFNKNLYSDLKTIIVNKGNNVTKGTFFTDHNANTIKVIGNATKYHIEHKGVNIIYYYGTIFVNEIPVTELTDGKLKNNTLDIYKIYRCIPINNEDITKIYDGTASSSNNFITPVYNINLKTSKVEILTVGTYELGNIISKYAILDSEDSPITNLQTYTKPIPLIDCVDKYLYIVSRFVYNKEDVIKPKNTLLEKINITLTHPTYKITNGNIYLINPNNIGEIYYTYDGKEPTINSTQYVTDSAIEFDRTNVLKAKVILSINNKQIESETISIDYTYEDDYENLPFVKTTKGENKIDIYPIIKNFIDIAYNKEYETIKMLESISYNLTAIEEPFSLINLAEEHLNRRYSGDSLYIYTDECKTPLIDISQSTYKNDINNTTKPYYDKGIWNFNYFRNIPDYIYDYKTDDYLNGVDDENKLHSTYDSNKMYSDNQSLIYGKYFVVRFVFNNIVRVKFDTINFNIKPY